jgi:hypothetical protein
MVIQVILKRCRHFVRYVSAANLRNVYLKTNPKA